MASVKLPNTLLLTGHQASSPYWLGAFFKLNSYKITPAFVGAGVELTDRTASLLLTLRTFLEFIPYSKYYV